MAEWVCNVTLGEVVDPSAWPDCPHQEHFDAPTKYAVSFDWDDAVPECRWSQKQSICELDEGHPMPHRFEPREGMVLFSARSDWA